MARKCPTNNVVSIFADKTIVQRLEISRAQSLEICRFCALEISRHCTIEVDE